MSILAKIEAKHDAAKREETRRIKEWREEEFGLGIHAYHDGIEGSSQLGSEGSMRDDLHEASSALHFAVPERRSLRP